MNRDDLVTIASYGSPQEASIAKGALATDNIPSYLMGQETANTLWHIGTALGGIKLQVAKQHASRASEVLETILLSESSESISPWVCPNCEEVVDEGFEICWSCGTPDERQDAIIGPKQNDDPIPSIPSILGNGQDRIEATSDADEIALRIWRSAIFGIFFFPLFLCSLYLIIKLTRQLVRQNLSPAAAQHFYGAMAIVIATASVLLGLLIALVWF